MNPEADYIQAAFPAVNPDRIVLVGGTVRDMLLGKERHDIDLAAALSHDELLSLGFRLVEAKNSAPVYFRHHHVHGKIEVVRLENMAALNDNLVRRDFTINAIAMTLSGAVTDPLGGERDLGNGLLRACSNRSFLDDPLRIFRGFRFETDGWRMTPETESLIGEAGRPEAFIRIPRERFSNEMRKALAGEHPERFFLRMSGLRVGEEFLPEIFSMQEIPAGPPEHHPEGDLLTHSLQVLQRTAVCTRDPLARFCAFFHDLGKLVTPPELYPKHHGHDDAGFELADKFCQRLCLPAVWRKALAWTSRLHGVMNRWDELRDATRLKMAQQAIKAGIADILPLVSMADKPVSLSAVEWDKAVHVAGMSARELGIAPERLEALPVEQRTSYLLQKRIVVLRGRDHSSIA